MAFSWGLAVFTVAVSTFLYVVVKFLDLLQRKLADLRLKADPESKRHGGELVAQVLKAHDVKFVFTLCGGHISPILVGCENLGIRVVDVRHEVTAAFAADAVARVSGTVGVCCVTAGPGLTNTVTAIKNAQMAESPVLLLGGAAATLLQGRGALQDIDQMALFKPLCKFCARVNRVREIPYVLRQAMAAAQSGTPGPVFVEFPIDTLYNYQLVKQEAGIRDTAKSLTARLVNTFLKHHVNSVFAGAWANHPVNPLPVIQPFATHYQVAKAAALIRKAQRPVILLGSQSTLPPSRPQDLQHSLKAMGIPCFLGGMSRGLLGRHCPIHIMQRRRDALKEADVVILAGVVCDFRLSYGRVLSAKSKVIAVNRNKDQLYKNSDTFWKPTLAFQVDPGSFLISLQQELGNEYRCAVEWPSLLKDRDHSKEEANRKKATEPTDRHLNPLKALYDLEDVMEDNTVMVADGGDFVGSAAYIVRPRGPLGWLDPGAFGTLGVGGGFALGVKLCKPDADVWVIYGDGSVGYSIVEYDTFVRHKVPIIAVIGNDAAWSQILREQEPMFGTSVGCMLSHTSYDSVAKSFGGAGFLIDRSNEDHTKEIFGEALACARQGQPALVNVMIGKSNFREGSISV